MRTATVAVPVHNGREARNVMEIVGDATKRRV